MKKILTILFIGMLNFVSYAYSDDKILNLLSEGKKLIFIRHAIAPGNGDPDNFNIEDCSPMENLPQLELEEDDIALNLNQKECVLIDGKIYTLKILREMERLGYIKKNLKFDKINTILEIGAGIGLLASSFFKLKKNIKYLIIDIPPTICFAEYYLSNLSLKVFGYQDLIKIKQDLK